MQPSDPHFICPRHPYLVITLIPGKGRGVVATQAISAGTLLEVAPVLRLTEKEWQLMQETIVDCYAFEWEHDPEPGFTAAIVLGIISIANHSARPNAKLEWDYTARTLRMLAQRDIGAGEEVTIDYDGELWFEIQE